MHFTATILAGIAFALSPQKYSPDEEAVRAGIDQLPKGWNARSGKDFAVPFDENADYVVVNGMHIKGKNAIAVGHQMIFDGIYKVSSLKGETKSVRFVRPDLAISHTLWDMNYQDTKGETVFNKAIASMTWLKSNGKWVIVSFQNTPIVPGA